MDTLKAIRLFLTIVWRKFDPMDNERISVSTAWKVATGIWYNGFLKEMK